LPGSKEFVKQKKKEKKRKEKKRKIIHQSSPQTNMNG
jgi:hypothetical protein